MAREPGWKSSQLESIGNLSPQITLYFTIMKSNPKLPAGPAEAILDDVLNIIDAHREKATVTGDRAVDILWRALYMYLYKNREKISEIMIKSGEAMKPKPKLTLRPFRQSLTTFDGLAQLWFDYHGNDAIGILEEKAQEMKGKKAHIKQWDELQRLIQILQKRSHPSLSPT